MVNSFLQDETQNSLLSSSLPFSQSGGLQEKKTEILTATTFFSELNDQIIPSVSVSEIPEPIALQWDLLTGQALDQVEDQLNQFSSEPNFLEQIKSIFGDNFDVEQLDTLVQSWKIGQFSETLNLEFVSKDEITGANGAFAAATNTIYLSQELLSENAANLDIITNVLLEEIGHLIDSQINLTDTAGDEGELFAALILGKTLTPSEIDAIKAEDDQATVVLKGESLVIEQDNTLSTAYNVGTLSGTRTFSNWVGSTDTYDYYRFYLASPANFNLVLNGLSADADVQLLNSNGNVITGSYSSGSTRESITRSLSAGTYYVQVYPYGNANTNYNLSLSVPVSTPTISANQTISGTLSTTDPTNPTRSGSYKDDYRLTGITAGQQVRVNLNSSAFDTYLQVINASTGQVATYNDDANSNTRNSQLSFTAQSGVNYLLRATSYSSGSTGNYSITTSSTGGGGGGITDPELRSIVQSRAADGVLNRNDMIAILRDAKDGGVISGTELTDLRNIVANASNYNMPAHVRVLSNKVVNTDPANQRYQGSSLGNLYGGSSATQMEKLVGKWFLGNDRPSTSYTYRLASGSLFQNGVSYRDIKQGNVGDCYYLAGLGATAFRSPSTIQSMFIDNGDNTYTVRFYKNGVADYVTVDKYLPTYSWGDFAYADGRGGSYSSSSNELWVALAEKAYAQINESGWIGQDGTNSYNGISSGSSSSVIPQVSNRSANYNWGINASAIANAFNAGQMVTLTSKYSGTASNIVANHEYVLVGYNSSTQKFTLFNPWGVNGGSDYSVFKPGFVELSATQISASFDGWTNTGQQANARSNTLPPRETLSSDHVKVG